MQFNALEPQDKDGDTLMSSLQLQSLLYRLQGLLQSSGHIQRAGLAAIACRAEPRQ